MSHSLASRTRDELLERVEAHLAATGMNEGSFGLKAVNDGKLVRRLRSGSNITLALIERIESFIRQHPPGSPCEPAPAEAAA